MTSAPEDWIRIGLQVLVVLVLGLGGCHLQGVASKSTSRPPIQGVHKKCLRVWSLIQLRAPCSMLLTPPLLCPHELRNSFADCRRSSHPKLPCFPPIPWWTCVLRFVYVPWSAYKFRVPWHILWARSLGFTAWGGGVAAEVAVCIVYLSQLTNWYELDGKSVAQPSRNRHQMEFDIIDPCSCRFLELFT